MQEGGTDVYSAPNGENKVDQLSFGAVVTQKDRTKNWIQTEKVWLLSKN